MANKQQIVLVTNYQDSHADDMVKALERLGHEPIRLNTDDIPLNVVITYALKSGDWDGKIVNKMNGRLIDFSQVRSIWWRRPADLRMPSEISDQQAEFASQEINHFLDSLWALLDCYWVSLPANIRQAGWKLEQLKRANQFGFKVPRTLITTDPKEAKQFYDACDGKMIFKVMTDPFLAGAKPSASFADTQTHLRKTMTTLVSKEQLAAMGDHQLAPCMFQEYIPKQIELRVTVIGRELFAAEIHSQEQEHTVIDWRHYEVDIPFYKANLSAEMTERCLAFVDSYGLNFSSMDFILTLDGRYVFVENNPNGQFMFVEKLVPELKMTEALAACLIRGSN